MIKNKTERVRARGPDPEVGQVVERKKRVRKRDRVIPYLSYTVISFAYVKSLAFSLCLVLEQLMVTVLIVAVVSK